MKLKSKLHIITASLIMAFSATYAVAELSPPSTVNISSAELTEDDRSLLLSLLEPSYPLSKHNQVAKLKKRWSSAYIAPSLEIFNFIPDPSIRKALLEQLVESTGEDFGTDINAWYRWLWNQPEKKVVGYDNFKADFYKVIDPRFEKYFRNRQDLADIRLDEIRWGGVVQDGIPPLRNPKMLSAAKATYLEDDNVVFGIEVNGDARAYPKRILAWHEMFTDTVGGEEVAGVYCTLCGFFVLYESNAKGLFHNLGTSGFLHRSNKLMYDKATQSLWNTIKGEPVLGPLVGKDISLTHQSVVTTTWGEWKRRHPDTKVLSLDTGHRRNYDEGVAYHAYFSTDELMFNTPYNDTRLKNKDEVLALKFKSAPHEQLAISAKYLSKNPIYMDEVGDQKVLVLTDKTGANRIVKAMSGR